MPAKQIKTPAKSLPEKDVTAKKRRLKSPKYKSFQLAKRIKHPVTLSNSFAITKKAAKLIWQNKKLFIGIVIVYGILNIILVHGLSSAVDVGSLKKGLDQAFSGNLNQLASSLTVFVVLIGSSGSGATSASSVYQTFLTLVVSLAIIWALRQVWAKVRVRVRDSFYHGMYPLVPFILVLLVIGLQLLPMLIGVGLYGVVVSNGIAIYAAEKFLWGLLALVLSLLSLYMVCSSLFALYIVTLPDMTPMKALRSARELVRYRRWTILRKILFLPLVLFVVSAAIMVPIITFVAPVAPWVFFIITMFILLAVHTYMYVLYRELLEE